MSITLTQHFIEAVAAKLPPKENIAKKLIEILSISREAAYRRLRGEVYFSFEEAVKVALALHLSLDELMNLGQDNYAPFYMPLPEKLEVMESYGNTLETYSNKLEKIVEFSDSILMMAYNSIPPVFFLPYETLSRFFLYKSFYHFKGYHTLLLDDVVLTDKMRRKQMEIVSFLYQFNISHYVLDWGIFRSFIKDIHYFYKLNLLSDLNMTSLQKELSGVLSDIDSTAKSGSFINDTSVSLYLADIEVEAPYVYMEAQNKSYSVLHLFSINALWSRNPKACQLQKIWIKSLIRYSTLISQSGEHQRTKFIEMQREYIKTMLDNIQFESV